MPRRPPSPPEDLPNRQLPPTHRMVVEQPVDFDIQRELHKLEEMIIDSARIPLIRLTLVDEDKILNQLDLVRLNLPVAFQKALSIIQQEQRILQDAEDKRNRIIQAAQQRASEILDETGIIQQAEIEAGQYRQQIQQECDALQNQTLAEIEQSRRAVTQDLQKLRHQTYTECQEIQEGADTYAESCLTSLEQQLSEMMQIVRNGKQQLYGQSPNRKSSATKPSAPSSRKRS